ncbi:peptide deformylase [Anaeromusa sp.]|jgi:peptide deformylase|uniref:peptide deformylase n=1 Tax=Anaeromusa sp. TaxID=1872520 RepID=UPI002611089E|nr:peptide deformylase [Anaeromusa sp.]MDD3156705.1 peptide deformylase [Anaeromusa sp.]MEA4833538.1 peptide deformylase [Anaeromusa sp.]NCB76103.1 peptide deformylase [Negativicutes bacterium]
MATLEIRRAGDPVLKKQCQAVEKVTGKIKKLLDDMAETMNAADGVGLAAPQVGVELRIVVIDVGEGLIELINPVLLEKEGCQKGLEGCLSVPGVFGQVERYEKVVVEGLNRSGRKIRVTGSGLLARALQHEMDHLDGVLFVEKADSLQKEGASS